MSAARIERLAIPARSGTMSAARIERLAIPARPGTLSAARIERLAIPARSGTMSAARIERLAIPAAPRNADEPGQRRETSALAISCAPRSVATPVRGA